MIDLHSLSGQQQILLYVTVVLGALQPLFLREVSARDAKAQRLYFFLISLLNLPLNIQYPTRNIQYPRKMPHCPAAHRDPAAAGPYQFRTRRLSDPKEVATKSQNKAIRLVGAKRKLFGDYRKNG
jgi:hypothetical protein